MGAGVVGLTLAYELRQRFPGASIAVVDKEAGPGAHASGRNSGVLHSGIYYAPGSLKARVCADGARRMKAFVRERGLALSETGKLIVAPTEQAVPGLDRLLANAAANGVNAAFVDEREAAELEPAARTVGGAIFCPDTATVDPGEIVSSLAGVLAQRGVRFRWGVRVQGVDEGRRTASSRQGRIRFGFLFNCAGAYADRIAHLCGCAPRYALVPFRGSYFRVRSDRAPAVSRHVYPVPDLSLPFLGIHVSRSVHGDLYVGPTALPALGRENYKGVRGANVRDAALAAGVAARLYFRSDGGFRRLVHEEIRNRFRFLAARAAARLVPALRASMLQPTAKVGIRPQLVQLDTGKLEPDYVVLKAGSTLHVLNAVSPGFTSSFAFARLIVDRFMNGRGDGLCNGESGVERAPV
ncbi:MAG: L-2-hydroxyglutarate oxidase [Gammaproteobacteria bacterium]